MTTSPQTSEKEPRTPERASGALWLYLLGFAVCVVLMYLLPSPYSTWVFIFLILGSVAWGVFGLRAYRALNMRALFSNPQAKLQAITHPKVAQNNLVAGVLALISFGLMIEAAIDLRPLNEQHFLVEGGFKLILGGLTLGAAILFATRQPALPKPVENALDNAGRFWWVFAGVGTLMIAVLAEINGRILQIPFLEEVSIHVQFALLFFGVLLVAYGLGGAPRIRAGLRELKVERTTLILLSGIMALALFLRLWNQEGTLRYLIDELHWSDAILTVTGSPTLRILTPMSGQSPYSWVFPYWQSGAVAIFGHNWTGFRFVSAIVGSLTVLAVYGLARALFDKKFALLGALVMATFPPHIHFSRVAMCLIADPLFGTLALMCTAWALRTNRRILWALAGVSLGMTQYFYEGGRLLFPPLVIGFVIAMALRGGMRKKWRGFVILLVAAVIVGAPFYYTLVGNDKPLFGRFNNSGLGTSYWSQLASDGIGMDDVLNQTQHVLTAFMMFGAHWDLSVYYGGQQALVNDILLPFFFFGCFYLFWRYPAPAFLVTLWIVATGLGNGLLRDTLVSARYYVVLPALALAIAAGARFLLPFFWLEPRAAPDGSVRRERRLRWAIPVVVVGVIAVYQVNYYFGPHLEYFNDQVRDSKGYRDGIDVALRAVDLPGNTQIYIVGKPDHDQNVPRDFLNFLIRDGDPTRYFPLLSVTTDTISPKYLLDLPRGVNYAFYVAANEENTMELIRRYFPNASPAQFSTADLPSDKEYVLFFVPSSTDTPNRIIKLKTIAPVSS